MMKILYRRENFLQVRNNMEIFLIQRGFIVYLSKQIRKELHHEKFQHETEKHFKIDG